MDCLMKSNPQKSVFFTFKERLMASLKDLSQDYQGVVNKGINSIFSLQQQVLDGTLELYEKGLTARESGYSKTKDKVEELRNLLEKRLTSGQDKVKSSFDKFTGKYMPESKERIDKVEKLVQESSDKVTDQVKKLFADGVDQNIKKTFTFEKDLVQKIKELFTDYESRVRKLLGSEGTSKKEVKVVGEVAKTKSAPKVVSGKTKTVTKGKVKTGSKTVSKAKVVAKPIVDAEVKEADTKVTA
jgi:hypothetical protein